MSTTGGTPQGTSAARPAGDVRKKFKSAVTDSGSRGAPRARQKPGISNLIEIMSIATGEAIPEIEARYDGRATARSRRRSAEAVVALLDPIQHRYEELRADQPSSSACSACGADKAREVSAPTLEQMYERMGFVRP